MDDRFARQNRYEPPPEFPLASPSSGIVHHLSGLNMYAHTQTILPRDWGRQTVPTSSHCHFHCARGFATLVLAHMLNSLVRVSRRGEENHFVATQPASVQHAGINSPCAVRPRPANRDPACHSVPPASRRKNMARPTLVSFASVSASSGTL